MTATHAAPLAIDGGTPVRAHALPSDPPLETATDADPLAAFEAELSELVGGARVAVACAGGEAAFALALRATLLERGRAGAEVAVPALHAEPFARALLTGGLRPLPVEVDHDGPNPTSRGLAAAAAPALAAVVVTHAFGHPAAMGDLLRLAEHHQLAVIEDVTEALGAAYAGVPAGAIGALATFGGGPGHLVTAAGVGAVLVPDVEAAARLRAWRDEAGGPPREPVLRLALAELRAAPEALHARRQAAWHLSYELRGVRGVSAMPHARRIRHAYDRYVLRVRSVLWERSLEETVEALRAEGIAAEVAVGPPLHEDPDVRAAFEEDDPRLDPARFAIAGRLAGELIALPLSAAMTATDMNDVAAAIRKVAAWSERADEPRGAGRARTGGA